MGAKQLNPTSLTPEQEEIFFEDALACIPMYETAQKLGFTSKYTLFTYCTKNPEFHSKIKQARLDACDFIEDQMWQIPEKYDAKKAKVVLDMYCRLLAFRNPAKYSQRIDLNVNQTVSIRYNLEAADSRVKELLRDVTPIAIDAVNTR